MKRLKFKAVIVNGNLFIVNSRDVLTLYTSTRLKPQPLVATSISFETHRSGEVNISHKRKTIFVHSIPSMNLNKMNE